MAQLVDESQLMYDNWEPKTKNRFLLTIDGIPSFIIKTAGRPKFTSNRIVIDHINTQRYLKGKTVWETIGITLYDPISPSGTQATMEWLRLHHESATGRDGYNDFYKKDIGVLVLGPSGDKVEQWTLKGTFMTDGDFGDLDWADDEPLDIQLTLSYDYALLQY